ncbi:MAG: 2-isopropylmalate synthase, partial [Clostridia bacterium]|nr:2-isopropylmalate synthase [Clostridia bacterium]
NLPEITKVYERVTRMKVSERQPYSGQLVFAAFSGSHQDAIAKGMKYRVEKGVNTWTVPYLPLDPADVGRVYEADVIRINSQSGKGGIGYILETQFKLILPPKMREVFGYHVKSISDHAHKELSADEVHDIFLKDFVNLQDKLAVLAIEYKEEGEISKAKVLISYNGQEKTYEVSGNGRLDCASNAIKQAIGKEYTLESYIQHALEEKSNSKAASYVSIVLDGKTYWGTGIHTDIMTSSVYALVSAINRSLA